MMNRFFIVACFTFLSFFHVPTVLAQSGQTLTVTPPLFQLSVEPGGLWQSYIKVVNSNAFDLTVFAEVVNFAPEGESGQGKFIPLINGNDIKATLAEWINVNPGPYVIEREQSGDIPFTIEVPEDASPGGHFAAILITTQPPAKGDAPVAVITSQSVTSLFFIRIEGDVIEKGDIREFRILDRFVETPEIEVSLRFENKGNVHLQPKGDIIVTNMWGRERGVIPVNHKTNFGNVLPSSIRDFRFSWKGESSITEIGRYKAVATLGYGEDESQNVSATAYFWVVPVKATLITLAVIGLIIGLIIFMVRLYVRRMLALAGVSIGTQSTEFKRTSTNQVRVSPKMKYRTIAAPITSGAIDLKTRLRGTTEFFDVLRTFGEFASYYKTFFISVGLLIIMFVTSVMYINEATKDARTYKVTIHEGDASQTLDAEEVIYTLESPTDTVSTTTQTFRLELMNGSGEPGLGAQVASMLKDAGYTVDLLDTTDTPQEKTTVITDDSLSGEKDSLMTVLQNGFTKSIEPLYETPDGRGTSTTIRIILGTDILDR